MPFSFPPAGRRVATAVLSLALLLPGLCTAVWADPVGPSSADRHVALAVTSLLKHEHLLRHPLDAEISERCMKTFLQDLDPMKMYFYQSDYDEFAKYKDRLADRPSRATSASPTWSTTRSSSGSTSG